MNGFLEALRQPEYLHVLLNPLPVYGLAIGTLALLAALVCRSRPAILIALGLVALTAGSAWPVYSLGQTAYETVSTTVDPAGQEWLDAHRHRAESLIWTFYLLAALAAAGIGVGLKWPRALVPLALAAFLGALGVLGAGGYIAYAGGRSGILNSDGANPRLRNDSVYRSARASKWNSVTRPFGPNVKAAKRGRGGI